MRDPSLPDMNKLLNRQLRKLYGDATNVPQELAPLIKIIDATYDGFDQDRDLTVRSLELSSRELMEANKHIRDESEHLQDILEALRAATTALRPITNDSSKAWLVSTEEAVSLANSLRELIAEQKLHERKLEESNVRTENEKAKAEAILQSIGDGVFAVDLNCRILLMNPVAEQLSGYTFAEAKEKYYRDIFHFVKERDPQSEYPLFIEEVIRTGKIKALSNHTLLIQRDHTQLPVSDSAAPIKDESGEIFGCIVVVRDASRERKLEREKNDFISIAAHQLRTPLGIIRWTLEMLNSDPQLSDGMRDKVGRAYESDKRLITLVNDLLNVSRIDQGNFQNEPVPTDIFEVIRSVVSELAPLADLRKVTLDLLLSDGVSNILIDPNRLREVVQNLVSNAIKYNVEKGRVTISASQIGQSLRMSVADEGIGIPVQDHPRIFSKFFRAKNALKNDTTGSGLGLFVVKSYVEGWGGTITFQSVEGKGTTFEIELPIGDLHQAPSSTPQGITE